MTGPLANQIAWAGVRMSFIIEARTFVPPSFFSNVQLFPLVTPVLRPLYLSSSVSRRHLARLCFVFRFSDLKMRLKLHLVYPGTMSGVRLDSNELSDIL